jgi:hypothetical protein
MTHSTSPSRPGARTLLLALAAVTSATLAFAGPAGANSYRPVTGPGLQAAVTAANTNTCAAGAPTFCTPAPGTDRILLDNTSYSPTSTMTISDNLIITGSPKADAPVSPKIEGSQLLPLQQDLFVVAPNVSAVFKALLITNSSESNSVLHVRGNLEFDNAALSGNNGVQATIEATGTAVFNNADIDGGNSLGMSVSGTAILNNVTVADHQQGGIDAGAGVLRLNNSIVANNDPQFLGIPNCFAPATSSVASIDNDGSCAVATNADPQLGSSTGQGGPSPGKMPQSGSPAINTGDNSVATCATVDQRYFVRTDGLCDVGSMEAGAPRDSTAPTCVVTRTDVTANPAQQDVTAQDGGSGLDAGDAMPASFPPYSPTFTGFPDIRETGGISNVNVTNGSVSWTPFTAASRSPLVLTATKGDQTQKTRWSFVAKDQAGNQTNCR